MKDLSLYILDISMNSVRAGAKNISIILKEENNVLTLRIEDNGCGMSKEQVEKLSNPFFTTRTTRKVGLGVPFLTMLAEQTGGYVRITSRPEGECENHGTEVEAVFHTDHIDFVPLGDVVESVITLIQGNPDTDYVFVHESENFSVGMNTAEMREILGGEVPLNTYEVLAFIREYLKGQYSEEK
ncbi:MAG: sensor histidine kinase [Clostridia bacterium]|nr:sensor histidine kinase [Clostridia bacterium]